VRSGCRHRARPTALNGTGNRQPSNIDRSARVRLDARTVENPDQSRRRAVGDAPEPDAQERISDSEGPIELQHGVVGHNQSITIDCAVRSNQRNGAPQRVSPSLACMMGASTVERSSR